LACFYQKKGYLLFKYTADLKNEKGGALSHVKSNRSKGYASHKNQTIRKINNSGIYRNVYGVDFERTEKIDTVYRQRIQESLKREKTAILNTFISQTGYERKYAIYLLANEGKPRFMQKSVRLATAHASGSRCIYEKIYDSTVWMPLSLSGRRLTASTESFWRHSSKPILTAFYEKRRQNDVSRVHVLPFRLRASQVSHSSAM